MDRLHFGVQLPVDLKEGGRAVEAGHEADGGCRVELGGSDHGTLIVGHIVHVLQLPELQMALGQRLSFSALQ